MNVALTMEIEEEEEKEMMELIKISHILIEVNCKGESFE